jgi:hypothetical protein
VAHWVLATGFLCPLGPTPLPAVPQPRLPGPLLSSWAQSILSSPSQPFISSGRVSLIWFTAWQNVTNESQNCRAEIHSYQPPRDQPWTWTQTELLFIFVCNISGRVNTYQAQVSHQDITEITILWHVNVTFGMKFLNSRPVKRAWWDGLFSSVLWNLLAF